MKMNKDKLDVFYRMMEDETRKLGCRISCGTDSEYSISDITVDSPTYVHAYCVIWNDVHSLTEAAVPILSDVKMHLELKNYCANDVEQTKNLYYGLSLSIKDVIFNPPATIVLWMDGTKTVVKDQGEVFYDPEKGMAMAIAKKALGNQGNYYNQFAKYIDIWEEKQEANSTPTHMSSVIDEFINKFRDNLSKTNYNTATGTKRPKIDTDIVFKTKKDAIAVLYNLREIMNKYGYVAVSDLYDLAELKCDYTYARYGWTKADDIHNAKIIKTRTGYMIDLPEPTEIK